MQTLYSTVAVSAQLATHHQSGGVAFLNYNKAWEAFDPVDMGGVARAGRGWNSAWPPKAEHLSSNTGSSKPCWPASPLTIRTTSTCCRPGTPPTPTPWLPLPRRIPDDVDVQALAADALVNITAWALWDITTGEPAPGSRVVEAKRILDDALATPDGREHPMILHLYLHTMEMSAIPQDALPAADLLRNLVPDAGHLVHMPSHIDVLCGNYRDSVVSNLSAVQVDRRFVDREGPLNFYSL